MEVMYRQVHEAVPRPGELNRAIGAELEGVLLRALAKEPEVLYATAEAMGAALGEVAAAEAARFVPTVPVGRSNDDAPQSAQRTAPRTPLPAWEQSSPLRRPRRYRVKHHQCRAISSPWVDRYRRPRSNRLSLAPTSQQSKGRSSTGRTNRMSWACVGFPTAGSPKRGVSLRRAEWIRCWHRQFQHH